jgi:hypothetical protein
MEQERGAFKVNREMMRSRGREWRERDRFGAQSGTFPTLQRKIIA